MLRFLGFEIVANARPADLMCGRTASGSNPQKVQFDARVETNAIEKSASVGPSWNSVVLVHNLFATGMRPVSDLF